MKGEQDNIQKALERYSVPEEVAEEKEPVFSNEEEAVRWVMENSDDINEVLGTYESVRELQKDATLPRWQQELQGIKINPESFYRESDRNLATPELKRGWLSRNGRSIDEVAHDLSNYGIEVTSQDIVDFMLENPSGRVRHKSGELDVLGQRFSELATKASGVKIGKPDSPTGKLFIENMRTSNNMEQLRNEINDAQRAEEEVLRSMAEQREAERESNVMDEEIKPVGKGVFGNIYDQFRGKARDAVRFLLNNRGGDLLGVFHRNELGDIDLIWGSKEKNQGFEHIIDKHVNQLHDFETPEDAVSKIEDVINNGKLIKDKWDKATFEKDGYRVVVRKNVRGDNGEIVDEKKNWVVTAFDNDKSQKEKSSSATTLATPDNTSGSRAVASDEVSTVKGTESFSDTQEEEGKSGSPLFREVEARNVQSRLNMTPEERRNSLASETEDVVREDQIFLNDALGVSASMESNGIEDVNRRFNEELDAFEKGEQKGDLHLGLPGDVLLASGLNNTEIYITPKTLKEHFGKHGLNVDDIKDLPSALNNPLLVYEWGDKAKSLVVITNIEHDKGRITAAIKLERNGNRLEVNELASVHPKERGRFVNEMTNAKRGGLKEALRYVQDKTKALDWLGLVPPEGTASLTKQELDIANVIKDFGNPTLLEGEIPSAIDGLSDELGVPVNRVKSRKDLPEGIQRQMKNGRYPGLFDPKTGEVYMVMDEITNVADAQATMLHEIVGHKGIRGLFEDKIGEFTSHFLD